MRGSHFSELHQVHQHLMADAERATDPERRAHCRHLASIVFRLAKEDEQRVLAASRFVFRPAGDAWEMGAEGSTHLAIADSPIGARAAHLALTGAAPALAALTAAKHADRVLRDARSITAAWAERHGCRELATAIRALEIRGGHVRHVPRPGGPTFVLL